MGWPIAVDDTGLTVGSAVMPNNKPRFFTGAIDELRVFGRHVSPQEIRQAAGLD